MFKDELQSWELDSALYASLDGESAPDCTPEHTLPGARCSHNHRYQHSSYTGSSLSIHTPNPLQQPHSQPKSRCLGSINGPTACSSNSRTSNNSTTDRPLSSLLSQQLSELCLQSSTTAANQSTGSSSGCHSQSTLTSDETLYVNTRPYQNWSQFDRSNAQVCHNNVESTDRENDECNQHVSSIDGEKSIEVTEPFDKRPSGQLLALYSYVPVDENDVHVRRGELLTLLNRDDPNWLWVVKQNGQQGFVPTNFVCPLELVTKDSKSASLSSPPWSSLSSTSRPSSSSSGPSSSSYHIGVIASGSGVESSKSNSDCFKSEIGTLPQEHLYCNVPCIGSIEGTSKSMKQCEIKEEFDSQMVVLFDFEAQAPDDLSVRRGEWVMTRRADQQVDGWLWVYSPRSSRSGYIPKAYARPPAITSL